MPLGFCFPWEQPWERSWGSSCWARVWLGLLWGCLRKKSCGTPSSSAIACCRSCHRHSSWCKPDWRSVTVCYRMLPVYCLCVTCMLRPDTEAATGTATGASQVIGSKSLYEWWHRFTNIASVYMRFGVFCSLSTLNPGVWSLWWLVTHPCVKAQVKMMCNRAKLGTVLHKPAAPVVDHEHKDSQ